MKKVIALVALGTLGVLATVAACGSDDEPKAEVPGDGGSGSLTPDGSTSTPPPTGDGSITPTGDSSVTPGDGSTPTGDPDGGTLADGGPGGTTTSITCGTTTCALPGQVCCVYDTDGAQTFTFTCVTGTTCPALPNTEDNPPALSCASAANCAATDVCCLTQAQDDSLSSACKPADQCTGDSVVLCDPAQPNVGCQAPDECSSNDIKDWNLPNGYGFCQEP
jgi:hypothetical protein